MPDRLRQILNVLLAFAQVIVGVMSNTGRFGPTVGDISEQTRSLIVPAGYAFSIWGVIYAGCLVYAVDQMLPSRRRERLFRRIGPWTALAFAMTTLWVLVFPRGWFVLSNVIILVLLGSLAIVFRRVVRERRALGSIETIFVYGTFGLFLGWVTIASAANLAQTAVAYGVFADRTMHLVGAIGLLVLFGLGATIAAWRLRGPIPFALAIIWALIAIAIEHGSTARPSAIAAAVLIIVILTTTLTAHARRR